MTTDRNYGGDRIGHGGQWLGLEFSYTVNGQTFPLQVLVDGIMAFIKDHELEQLGKVEQKL